MSLINPDLIAYAIGAGVVLIGTLLIGWQLGVFDERERHKCESQELRKQLAEARFNQAKSAAQVASIHRDLERAGINLAAARIANRKLAMKKAISSSPLAVRHAA